MTTLTNERTSFRGCVDDAESDFEDDYDNMNGSGFKHEVLDVYEVCKAELDDFKNKTNEEMEQEVG